MEGSSLTAVALRMVGVQLVYPKKLVFFTWQKERRAGVSRVDVLHTRICTSTQALGPDLGADVGADVRADVGADVRVADLVCSSFTPFGAAKVKTHQTHYTLASLHFVRFLSSSLSHDSRQNVCAP